MSIHQKEENQNKEIVSNFSIIEIAIICWQVFRNIAFLPLILCVSMYLFLGVGQLHDVIMGLKQEFNEELKVYLQETMLFEGFVYVYPFSLILWAFITYTCTRIILFSPIEIKKNSFSVKLIRCTPWFLSTLPFLIMTLVFVDVPNYFIITLCCFSICFGTSLIFRNKIDKWFPRIDWKPRPFTTIREDWNIIKSSKAGKFFLLFNSLTFLFLLIIFLLPINWGVAIWMGPVPIVIMGMAFLTLITTLIIYFNDDRHRPISVIAITILIVLSYFTDNSSLQDISSPTLVPKRPDIETHFYNWAKARSPKFDSEIPVIIIAAEGGGIRALNWTARSLWAFNSKIGNFNKYLYAISGVSGGAVGATFYNSFVHDRQRYLELNTHVLSNLTFRRICRDDFVSGLTSAYLFPEMIQNFIPYPINYFDRSKWLENSWSNSYRRMTKGIMDSIPNESYRPEYRDGLNTLDMPFTQLWKLSNNKDTTESYNYELPSLFLNCTLSETGQKAIVSNLSLDSTSFQDVVDVIKYTNKDMPVKTAASSSARFPFVTSGGLIENYKNNKIAQSGHLTDGGFFDNTGIETAVQILNSIIKISHKHNIKVRPTIIFLQNGNGSTHDRQEALKTVRSVRIPWESFFNSWNRGTITRNNMYSMLFKRTYVDLERSGDIVYTKLSLAYSYEGEYPLGWYVSKPTIVQLNKRLNTLFYNKNFFKSYPELDTLKKTIMRLDQKTLSQLKKH
ncbi:patatin-like phospholipase family protein [Nostoc sp. CHAB 5834]|nr:patatin-like phospholipase family protein [Nostoc sp. CHAB 5834]